MAISFSLRLQDTQGRQVPVVDYRVHQQIVLAGESDSWPRTIAFSLNAADPITEIKLRQFFDQRGDRSFEFTVMRAGDGVRLVGQAPGGTYALGVMIEDLRLQSERLPVKLAEDYCDTVTATVVPDPRTVRHVRAFDPAIQRLLQASTLEGENGIDWLADATKRANRRACIQNILAKLRCAPSADNPLLALLTDVFVAAPDRIYAAVDARLHARLQEMAAAGEWSHEGPPESPCHARLLQQLIDRRMVADCSAYTLDSFRQKEAPSVQIVVAVPPEPTGGYYADIDIDLGNPLMDVRGLVVHASEVASGETTDHLAMWRTLADDPAVAAFLAYEVAEQAIT